MVDGVLQHIPVEPIMVVFCFTSLVCLCCFIFFFALYSIAFLSHWGHEGFTNTYDIGDLHHQFPGLFPDWAPVDKKSEGKGSGEAKEWFLFLVFAWWTIRVQ